MHISTLHYTTSTYIIQNIRFPPTLLITCCLNKHQSPHIINHSQLTTWPHINTQKDHIITQTNPSLHAPAVHHSRHITTPIILFPYVCKCVFICMYMYTYSKLHIYKYCIYCIQYGSMAVTWNLRKKIYIYKHMQYSTLNDLWYTCSKKRKTVGININIVLHLPQKM